MTTQPHIGELALRRFRAGELPGEESHGVREHTEACAHCKGRLRSFDEEQRRFESELAFERFEAGVTRAARRPRAEPTERRWLFPVMAMAAMVSVALAAGPLLQVVGNERPITRTKGGASVDLFIAAGNGGPQRLATPDAPEALGPGEHVRIGFQSGGHRYVMALSMDADGVVTPLYPEQGTSAEVDGAPEAQHYLPTFEFTGEGAERVVVVLSQEPLEYADVHDAAQRAYEDAGREVTRMGDLELNVEAEQFHRTLLKP